MKRTNARPSSKPSSRRAPLNDLEPKKQAKGGTLDSRAGIGILKSTDGGRTW